MHIPMWHLRLSSTSFDPRVVYDGHPTLFTIKLHHGGEFTKFPNVNYIEGTVTYVDMVDIEEFSIHEMDAIMKGLGYSVPPVIYYHFRVPKGDMHFGLRALGNDDDVLSLSQYVKEHKLIRVYTEHGITNLLTYFMAPKPVRKIIIEQLEETDEHQTPQTNNQPSGMPQTCIPPVIANEAALALSISPEYNKKREFIKDKPLSSCIKKLVMDDVSVDRIGGNKDDAVNEFDHGFNEFDEECNNINQDFNEFHEACNDIDQGFNEFDEAANDFDIGLYQQILQSNKQNVDDEFNEGEENAVNKEVTEEENHDRNEMNDENVEMRDFAVDDGNEDNIETGEDNHERSDESEDSDDSDFWVDEDNIIPDVQVDMRDFYMNIDLEAEFLEKRLPKHRENDSDEVNEELDVIDNDQWDSLDEGSDIDRKRRVVIKELGKETRCSQGEIHKVTFRIGQKYKNKKELKENIQLHALETRRNIFFVKNDKMRLRAICKGTVAFNDGHVGEPTPCPWVIQGSRSDVNSNWFIKTYNHEHKCLQTRKVRSATAKFISKQIMDQIESNPTIPVRALQEQLQKDYQVGYSIHKVFRAKSTAKKLVQGDYKKQYDVLRDYILELQSTNPETTVKLEFDSEPNLSATSRRFKRMYVCLGGMKKGFRACLRDFLDFDGAFMKGPFPGQILTAVGVDSNNGIYPLAYAIVETENTDSWNWFLECIADDLDLYANSNFTFISDRQKGLQTAISQLFPCAEHRFCLRHIHDNMRKIWRTNEYKEHLWNCATATTVPEFNHRMQQFSSYDVEAYNWLKQIPPQHWARSHFTGRAVSDMLLNNLCEVFNSKLIEGRDKPLITCLEYIREYMMKRICNVIKVQKKCVGPLTPSAIKIMEKNVNWASQYTVRWNGSDKYQVQVLNDKADNGEEVGELHTYAHRVHWLETWKAAYVYKVEPIKGRAMWPISECPIKITPPLHKNQPGRPKKKRRQSAEEKSQKKGDNVASGSGSQSHIASRSGKLTRKFIQVTCSKCKIKGHNARTCKGQGGK
uniref:MULE transposase domain-containing protein n=1 Tax=Lactuca sativa TaxID=4236 RepID=A0A9R1UDL8_LACSA|nr:hypothetical protein LSAT_V11C900500550 [Lactuca sativa]